MHCHLFREMRIFRAELTFRADSSRVLGGHRSGSKSSQPLKTSFTVQTLAIYSQHTRILFWMSWHGCRTGSYTLGHPSSALVSYSYLDRPQVLRHSPAVLAT